MKFFKDIVLNLVFWFMASLSIIKLVDLDKIFVVLAESFSWTILDKINIFFSSWFYLNFKTYTILYFVAWFFLVVLSYKGIPKPQRFYNLLKPKNPIQVVKSKGSQ